jgi:hypothetical protein
MRCFRVAHLLLAAALCAPAVLGHLQLPTRSRKVQDFTALVHQLRGGASAAAAAAGAATMVVAHPDAAALKPRESYHLSRKCFHFLTIFSIACSYR